MWFCVAYLTGDYTPFILTLRLKLSVIISSTHYPYAIFCVFGRGERYFIYLFLKKYFSTTKC